MPRRLKHYEHLEPVLGDTSGLTDRQAEVAQLLALGLTVQEIADTLDVSPETVKCHMDRLKDRFHACNKADLLCQMWMHGILQARHVARVLTICLCVLAAFPVARTSTKPSHPSRKYETLVRVGRKEIPSVIGGAL